MSEVQHTPGPWFAEHETGPTNPYATADTGVWSQKKFDAGLGADGVDTDPMDGAWICGIWGKLSPEDFANARLIAATPDLVEVLHECEEYFDNKFDADCDQDGFIPNKEMQLLSLVRATLAKAGVE